MIRLALRTALGSLQSLAVPKAGPATPVGQRAEDTRQGAEGRAGRELGVPLGRRELEQDH